MWAAIKAFFASLFGKDLVKPAKAAGLLIALNNKEKVAAVIPMAQGILDAAKAGKVDNAKLGEGLSLVALAVKDPKVTLALSMLDFPDVPMGTINPDVIAILQAFIDGCKAGVA